MAALARGENTALHLTAFPVTVLGAATGSCDVMVFQITGAGRVRSDADFVFFNNPTSPEGAVRVTGPGGLDVDLGRVPSDIDVLRVAVVLDDNTRGSLSDVSGLGVSIGDILMPATGLTTERAAVLAEVYRRGDAWKVRNVSAGWDAGFPALVTEHGVTVDDTPEPAPAPAAPEPAGPPVNLGKITLTKSAPTVSLAKSAGAAGGTMRVNLNWTRGGKGGMFRKKVPDADLDLGCLYELADGSRGVIQALGDDFGSLTEPPWILLDGDDRSGLSAEGENLLIDLAHVQSFRRILVFAYIYEGVPNWSGADGVVTMYPAGGTEIEVRLDSPDEAAVSCAIALLEVRDGTLHVTREVRYLHGTQRALDEAYGWGLTWTQASK